MLTCLLEDVAALLLFVTSELLYCGFMERIVVSDKLGALFAVCVLLAHCKMTGMHNSFCMFLSS